MVLESLIEDAVNCLERAASASSNIARFLSSSYKLLRANWDSIQDGEGTLQDQMQKMGYDPLTGLLNNKKAFEEFKKIYTGILNESRHSRPKSSRDVAYMACLYIDADHFKEANDVYRHAFGDKVIIALSDSLREKARQSDIFARDHGDEFFAIGRIKNMEDGRVWGTRVLEAVRGVSIVAPDGRPYRLTASIGVHVMAVTAEDVQAYNDIIRQHSVGGKASGSYVRLNRDGETVLNGLLKNRFDALLEAADAAMYKAKNREDGHGDCVYQSA
jgi:diguanylate cyclase (GGDEF)-like protein